MYLVIVLTNLFDLFNFYFTGLIQKGTIGSQTNNTLRKESRIANELVNESLDQENEQGKLDKII